MSFVAGRAQAFKIISANVHIFKDTSSPLSFKLVSISRTLSQIGTCTTHPTIILVAFPFSTPIISKDHGLNIILTQLFRMSGPESIVYHTFHPQTRNGTRRPRSSSSTFTAVIPRLGGPRQAMAYLSLTAASQLLMPWAVSM